jgi:DHA1 family inner membrane transport protein
MALSIGAIGFAGMFCVFSYLAPTMLEVTKVSPQWIPFGLAAFGVGGIIGNIAGGKLFDRLQFRAVGWIMVWSMAVLIFFTFAASSLWGVLLGIGLVGTMIAMAAPLQIRLMDIAHEAPSLAAASNHAAFNLANALGPWLGGMAITAGYGWTSTGYIGAATALVGLGIYLIARRMKGGR